MWYFLLVFFLGASVGSFINVLIDRTVNGESWATGRSHCDNCHKTLAWYDLIPIVSYLAYRGKSRCCHKPLSIRHPIVEMLVGLLFVWWIVVGFWFFRLVSAPLSVLQPAFWLLTGLLLVILGLTDLFYGVVLMPAMWIGTLMTVMYRIVLWQYGAHQIADLANAVILALMSFGFFWLLYKGTKGRGMAEGDMYVAFYLALLLGWPRGLLSMVLSFVLGAVTGVILIVSGLRTRKDTLPFVPFMVVASSIALVWGEQIIRFWY